MYDEAAAQDEDEKALQEALLLSKMPDKPAEAKPEAPKPAEVKPSTADVNLDQDFLNEVINDLGIDVDPNALRDLVNDGKKEEKKEGDKDKKEEKK